MALITLSGVINATDVNENFRDQISAYNTANNGMRRAWYWTLDVRGGLAAGTNVGLRTGTITPIDDVELNLLAFQLWRNSGTAAATATLTSPAGSQYLSDRTVSITASSAAGTEINGTRVQRIADSGAGGNLTVMLQAGVSYQMQITYTSGTIDRAYVQLLGRTRTRRE